jgi:hypothetical protein
MFRLLAQISGYIFALHFECQGGFEICSSRGGDEKCRSSLRSVSRCKSLLFEPLCRNCCVCVGGMHKMWYNELLVVHQMVARKEVFWQICLKLCVKPRYMVKSNGVKGYKARVNGCWKLQQNHQLQETNLKIHRDLSF